MNKHTTWGDLIGKLDLRELLLLIFSALLTADVYLTTPAEKEIEDADLPIEAFGNWIHQSKEMQRLITDAFAPSNMARYINLFEGTKCQ